MGRRNEFSFDLWLYNEIQKRGWSIADLSAYSGVSEQSISDYIKKKYSPTLKSFARLLEAFGKHIVIEDD